MLRLVYEKYLPIVFWPLFLGLLSLWTYQVITTPDEHMGDQKPGIDDGPVWEGPVRAAHIRLSESNEDGLVRWVLWSVSMEGIIGQGMELTGVEVEFTLPDESKLQVKAERGSWDENERHLEINGDVVGEYKARLISFTCDAIDYFDSEEKLAMSGGVNFDAEQEGIHLACTDVTALLSDNFTSIDFTGGVDVDMYKLR